LHTNIKSIFLVGLLRIKKQKQIHLSIPFLKVCNAYFFLFTERYDTKFKQKLVFNVS
ncbi:MAG: hypothetical protein ACJAYD_000746, partial [Patiriisocius sp.]